MHTHSFKIVAKGSFSFEECLWFLNRNFNDCLYRIYPNRIRKAFIIDGKPVLIEINGNPNGLSITILKGSIDDDTIDYIRQYVSDWFDLETNLEEFYSLLSKNKQYSYMVERYKGLRSIGIPDLFESLAWCIIGQQINLSFAYKVKRRLVERYGDVIVHEGENYRIFPTPEAIAKADPQELREMQFSNRKAEYLIHIAKTFVNKTVSKPLLMELPDVESRRNYLIAIRGIGVWTANYTLMKCLRERSSIPFGDTGLASALIAHQSIRDKKDKGQIEHFFNNFKGWESYLVFYLWRSLSLRPDEIS